MRISSALVALVGATAGMATGVATYQSSAEVTPPDHDDSPVLAVGRPLPAPPPQVETVLADHPDVADVAVLGVLNDDLGEEVKAVVALRPGVSEGPETEQRLIEYCRARLSRIKVPRTVDFVADVPRLATGKLNKRLLRDRYRAAQ